jgi:hypothetical protein
MADGQIILSTSIGVEPSTLSTYFVLRWVIYEPNPAICKEDSIIAIDTGGTI